MKSRPALIAVAVLTAGTLALTACGAGADKGPTTPGDTIRVGVSDPQQLIPGRQTIAYEISMSVWSPLAFLDEEGELSYVQAESVESPDAKNWTITLRDGWTFHDGTPVTAQAYVDTWNLVAYGPNAFENSGQLSRIVGYSDLNPAEGEPTETTMSGLEVVDEHTFTVELVAPDGQFPLQLTQSQTAFFPMPETAGDDLEAYNTHPVGNGPFKFDSDYEENQPIVTVVYDGFAGEMPSIDGITFVPYTDQETAYTDAQAGNLDIAGVTASKLTHAAGDFGDRFYSFEAPGITYLGLPLNDPRYQDIRVRQAISMAIDRKTISERIFGGTYVPATAWTPVMEPGTPVGVCGEYCEFDPDGARELLEAAGGLDGPVDIAFPGGYGFEPVYEAIANQLRQNLGVDANVAPVADYAQFDGMRSSGSLDGPYFSRWGALYPSQQASLRAVFTEGGGCVNCIPWYTPEIADALATADTSLDSSGAEYARVQDLIAADFPAPPLFFETYSWVTSERIADLASSGGMPAFAQVQLAD